MKITTVHSLILLFFASSMLTAQVQTDEAYKFPSMPSGKKWAKLNMLQKYLATEIPKAECESMSSVALVKTCLDHPLNSTIFAHNNPGIGFQTLRNNFYGFKALKERPDFASAMAANISEITDEVRTSRQPPVLQIMLTCVWIGDEWYWPAYTSESRSLLFEPLLRLSVALNESYGGEHGMLGGAIASIIQELLAAGETIDVGLRSYGKNDFPSKSTTEPLPPGEAQKYLDSMQDVAREILQSLDEARRQ